MNSWLDLEERFRRLSEPLSYLRLDVQWGSSGEFWNVTGMSRNTVVRQFEALSGIAGRFLDRALKYEQEPGRTLLQEKDMERRWYRALKDLSGEFKSELPATESDGKGTILGHIYYGSVPHIAEVSANLCLELHSKFPVRDERTFWQRLYDDYGRELVIGAILALITAIIGLFFG